MLRLRFVTRGQCYLRANELWCPGVEAAEKPRKWKTQYQGMALRKLSYQSIASRARFEYSSGPVIKIGLRNFYVREAAV